MAPVQCNVWLYVACRTAFIQETINAQREGRRQEKYEDRRHILPLVPGVITPDDEQSEHDAGNDAENADRVADSIDYLEHAVKLPGDV